MTVCTLVFVSIIAWLIYLGKDLPSFEELENYSPELATQVYSADGVLIKEFFTQRRSYTPFSQIPEICKQTVLVAEDHRFFDHWGFVPIRFFKVVITDLLTLSTQQGASTLTQQLARRLYLTPEKTIPRKIREILTAIQIERTYTKNEIFEMYMNHMQFGHGTYGIESAARRFFNKKLTELDISESALLAGMLQRPGALNPYRYPDRAVRRRNLILRRMLEEKVINHEQYSTAIQDSLNLVPLQVQDQRDIAPYFTEYIRKNLQDIYQMDLYKGGMKIYTTLDSRVQSCAERAIRDGLPKLQEHLILYMRKRKNFREICPPSLLEKRTFEQILVNKALVDSVIQAKCVVQVALVAIDPRNGHILAMVGGRDFKESQFNRAVQARRQPGSVFKPVVYTAAVDNGYMPYYEKLNQPIVVQMLDGTRWTPGNYDGSIGGKTTLREALKRSLNLVTARLVQEDVPPEQVVEYARYLGITSPLDAVDALALGSSGVMPLEMITAFGVFANRGVLVKPFAVLRIEDKFANLLQKDTPQSKGVLREETAYILTNLMQSVAWSGTGAASVSTYKFLRPAGGKTGTTNDYTDAWYITFTPQMVAGAWVGLDDPALSLGPGQTGAKAALPIVVPFIKAALDTLELPIEDFIRPPGIVDVEICRETQKIATEVCPEVLEEICDIRYLPTQKCDIHTGRRDEQNSSTLRQTNKRRIRY
ncbi:PBP1A family penicillin-binding protein [candidate division KSB1 bacterium]|nr:PBP1A family penicillin-binding protein [candidate division KSB1 bacterium]